MNEQELTYPDGQQPVLSIVFEFDSRRMPREIQQVEVMISDVQKLCPEAEISYDKQTLTDELVILTLMKKESMA